MDILTSTPAIILAGALSGLFVYLYAFKRRAIIAWEVKQIERIKRFIRRQLRKNSRIVEWANEPAKHGIPDAQFKAGQIKVFGDAWK